MPADVGSQNISLKFGAPGNSREINERFVDIRPTGIYEGGYLTVVDATHASISVLKCEIEDGTHQVRVETTAVVTLVVAAATPYLVLRWGYTGSNNDFMELLAVASGNVATNDLVVGKCTFGGGGALNGFVYDERSNPNVQDLFLKVEPTAGTELYTRIRAGRVQNGAATIQIPDQKSSVFVPPGVNKRIDLVYVDRATGTISIDSSGTVAASPVAPAYAGKLVLAEVTLTVGDTNIAASAIRDVRDFVNVPIPVDDSTIEISSGELAVKSAAIGYDLLKDVYDSGWFTCAVAGTYLKNHNLGSIALQVTVLFAPDSGGSPDLTNVIVAQAHFQNFGDIEVGPIVKEILANSFVIQAGADNVAFMWTSAGKEVWYTSGHYRVLAMRIA